MAKILFKNKVSTREDLDATIVIFNEMRAGVKHAELIFSSQEEMEEVDIHMIAYLILIKQEFRDLNIYFDFPYNYRSAPDREFEKRLCQYGTYAYLLTGISVFSAVFSGETINFDFNNQTEFREENFFVLSDYFVLLLYVNKTDTEYFNLLFELPLTDVAGINLTKPEADVWDIKSKQLYKNLNSFLTHTAIPKDRKDCIVRLGRLAFYKSLNQARVLSIYLDEVYKYDKGQKKTKIRAGIFITGAAQNDVYPFHQYDYYEKLIPMIRQMEQQSLVHHFVFSTIVSSNMFKQTTIDQTVKTLETLWAFTKELVYGIRELAKNLREHSDRNEGIIAMRIYSSEKYRRMQSHDEDQVSFFERYLSIFTEDRTSLGLPPAFFNLHVIDTGTTGMVPTLLKSSKNFHDRLLENSPTRKMLAADIEVLRSTEFDIKNLLMPAKQHLLHQQMKRSIAHLGLMLFYNLIERNYGFVILSSLNPAGRRDTVAVPELVEIDAPAVDTGTSFNILLPIYPDRPFDGYLPEIITLPADSSTAEMNTLEYLFEFTELSKGQPIPSDATKVLFKLRPYTLHADDRIAEIMLWEDLLDQIKETTNASASVIFDLDLEATRLDGSQLFRLLGHWRSDHPRKSLIITNLTTTKFEELININSDFVADKRDNAYWNQLSAVVVYHYAVIRQDRFYFADALWGNSRKAFRDLNRIIARNNVNYTTTFLKTAGIELNATTDRIKPVSHAFHSENILLPLDVILKTGDLTYFESNALVLLQNEIRPD